MKQKQFRCQEHKGKFQWFRYSGQYRADRSSQKQSSRHLLIFRKRSMVHGQRSPGESENHNREKPGHIHASLSIDSCSAPELIQIGNPCHIKPEYGIQCMMKATWNQQPVQKCIDTCSKRPCLYQGFSQIYTDPIKRRPQKQKNQ